MYEENGIRERANKSIKFKRSKMQNDQTSYIK